MRQAIVRAGDWYPGPTGPRARPIPVPDRPSRVWTLFHPADGPAPELPLRPVHNENAFLEDHVHDWLWVDGHLRYYSRVADRPVWLLLEYPSEVIV